MVDTFPLTIWEKYELNPDNYRIQKAVSGHINQTFVLLSKVSPINGFVLQRINNKVFTRPEIIAQNISLANAHLKANHPDYLFIAPLQNRDGGHFTLIEGEYWRLLPFVPNAIALEVLSEPSQAYEAAKQFGKLSRLLADIPLEQFEATIPRFHDLKWRKQQFDEALSIATPAIKVQAAAAIELAQKFSTILAQFESAKQHLPLRIMHHDTKISNVLLAEQSFKGLCVIDLDTLMPGYFISDLGDMMRTYLCPVDENEPELSKIHIREDFFQATIEGYLSEMATILNKQEKQLLLFSGKFMIYMQALRFLSDFLQGSKYYPINYPEQNLHRALNQFQLLKQLEAKEKDLEVIIAKYFA